MLRFASILPLLILLSLLSNNAHAACYYNGVGNLSSTVFTPPPTITVPAYTPAGTIIYTSGPIAPSITLELDCYNNTTSGIGGPTTADNTLFPTNIPWLSFRILHPDTISSALKASPGQIIPNAQPVAFSVASALQLVTNGQPITYTNQLSGTLGSWNLQICTSFTTSGGPCNVSNLYPINTFSTSAVRFVAPACTVLTDPTNVTLPTVQMLSLPVVNSTAGQTAFAVKLNCAASQTVSITLNTAAPASGLNGVIAPTVGTGRASGVGVQILDKNGNQLTFGTAIPSGTAAGGAFNINFFARYYRTGAITPGSVNATATYTLTYQ